MRTLFESYTLRMFAHLTKKLKFQILIQKNKNKMFNINILIIFLIFTIDREFYN